MRATKQFPNQGDNRNQENIEMGIKQKIKQTFLVLLFLLFPFPFLSFQGFHLNNQNLIDINTKENGGEYESQNNNKSKGDSVN